MRKVEAERIECEAGAVCFGWVKFQIKIQSNKEVDKRTKVGTDKADSASLIIMKGRVKEAQKRIRKEERYVRGTGGRRVVR